MKHTGLLVLAVFLIVLALAGLATIVGMVYMALSLTIY